MTKQKELNKNLLKILKEWQVIEDKSVKSTTEILAQMEDVKSGIYPYAWFYFRILKLKNRTILENING